MDCQEHFANIVASTSDEGWRAFLAIPSNEGRLYPVLNNDGDAVQEVRRLARDHRSTLSGVLLDVDFSRRGDLGRLIKEVRWALDSQGCSPVAIALTGGIDENIIAQTKDYAASYGIGLSALSGELLDFSFQVVEVNGQARSKLGVLPGKAETF